MIQLFKNSIRSLTQKEKKKFFILLLLNTLVNIADIISLAFLLVIINFYIHPTDPSLNFLPAWLADHHSPALIALFFLLFSIKNLFAYFVNRSQFRYVYDVAARISQDELVNYLETDYTVHSHIDSSVFIRRIGQQPIEFSQYVLTGIQQIISQAILVCLGITGILLFKAKLFLLLLIILLPPVFIASVLMKRKLKSERLQSRINSEKALQHLKEALNGYIESNIYNAHAFFKNRYGQFQTELNNHLAGLQIVQGIPNRMIEIFAVLGLFILVAVNQLSGANSTSLIIIGAFMAAAYKIIPGVVKIMNAAAQLKAYEHTIMPIDNDVKKVETPEQHNIESLESIELKNISLSFKDKNIFNNLNFCIQRGDFVGISGISGRGKTTMLNLLLGFLDTGSGAIYFNRKIANADARKKFRARISYAKQQAFLLHDTILCNITLNHDSYDHKKLAMAIQLSGLSEYIDSVPGKLLHVIDESGKNISGGQQKRITLARAFYKEADLYILDEPFSELDETSQKLLLTNLGQLAGKGKMIMMVTHNKDSLAFCNKQIILDEK